MEDDKKIIEEQQEIIDDMKDGLRAIGDYADALKDVLSWLLEDVPEHAIVNLTLTKITELVDQNI